MRLRRVQLETTKAGASFDRLSKKLEITCAKSSITIDKESSITIDKDLDKDMRILAQEGSEEVKNNYPKDSFQRLFWEQQEKAASLQNSKSMKWHSLFIKWCLYLCHHSGKAYETMRNSKCIHLPSQRTNTPITLPQRLDFQVMLTTKSTMP